MRPAKYSIRWLFGLTTIVAIACAAYAHAELASASLVVIHLSVMASAMLFIVLGWPHRRAFWIAAAAWGFIFPCFPGAFLVQQLSVWEMTRVDSSLAMSRAIVVAYILNLLSMVLVGLLFHRFISNRRKTSA